MEQQYHKLGYIHETLDQQTPDRKELRPAKELELDRDYAESVESYLGVDFERLMEILRKTETAVESIKLDWCEGYLQYIYDKGGDDALAELYDGIQQRIRETTNLFHSFDEALAVGESIPGLSVVTKGGSHKNDLSGYKDYGSYNAVTREIRIADDREEDGLVEEICSLMGQGIPIEFSKTLHHELVHAIQLKDLLSGHLFQKLGISKDISKAPLLDYGKALLVLLSAKFFDRLKVSRSPELREAHAFQESARDDIVSLFSNLSEGYNFKIKDQIMAAIVATRQLIALGLSLEEVGRVLLSTDSWDKKTGKYPKIQAYIDKKMEELHLTEDDLENLILAESLETEIQRNKAIVVTRLEVLKYCRKRFMAPIVPEAVDEETLRKAGAGIIFSSRSEKEPVG